MNMIYDTQRTVIDLRDQENGNYYDANELLDGSSEDQTIRIREGLQLAQRSRMYKYVCAICGQPLKLCNRVTNYKESWFFAHFANSEDCPIKTDSVYSPKSWTERWLSIFKESNLHKSILTSMYKLLSSNLYYVDVAMKKRISYPNITNEWRVPDIYANYNGKKIVFEFQLYTTFLNVIIDRNSFYRLVGIDIIWIFPYFTTSNQRMCEKDTYYSHNRNVFVFDTENYYNDGSDENKPYLPFDKSNYKFAQEESFKCGKLMLNCYWQEPRIENGKVQILWRHKLVSIDELTFDKSNHDVYYIDSDKLFYDTADSQTKKIYDEWKEAKEKRWNKIYIDIRNREDLIRNQQLQAEKKKEQQLIYNQKYEIIKKVQSQKLELQLFEKEGLWGYKCENIVIIEPKFCDAKLFCEGIAPVKTTENGHWGAIDLQGKKVIPYQYDEISYIANNCFLVAQNRKYGCINNKGNEIIPISYGKMIPLGIWGLLVNHGYWTYKKWWDGTWYSGSWNWHSGLTEIINLMGETIVKTGGDHVKEINQEIILVGEYNRWLMFNSNGKQLHGYTFSTCEIINSIIVASTYTNNICKYGVLSQNGRNIILPFEYDKIEALSESYLKIWSNGKFGLIDCNIQFQLNCDFDKIELVCNDYIKIKLQEKWALYNISLKQLSDFLYYDITFDDNKSCLYAYIDSEHYGELSKEGTPVTTKEKIGTDSYKFCRLGLYGLIDAEGNERIPNIYDDIVFIEAIKSYKSQSKDGFLKKYGLISAQFEILCEPIYDYIGDFIEGVAQVRIGPSFWNHTRLGRIDINGNVLIDNFVEIHPRLFIGSKLDNYALLTIDKQPITDYKYLSIEKLNDEFLLVKGSQSKLFGLLSMEGKVILEDSYTNICLLDDLILASDKNGVYGCYDSSGKLIISHLYQLFEEIGINRYYVRIDYRHGGIIDGLGNNIIPIEFSSVSKQEDNNIILEKIDCAGNRTYGLFDIDGHKLLDIVYNSIVLLENKFYKCRSYWGVGIFDTKKGFTIPCEYSTLEYKDGVYHAFKNNHRGTIDANGIVLYGEELKISTAIYAKERFGKWVFLSLSNKELSDQIYDSVELLSENLILVSQKNKYGLLNFSLNVLQPVVFEQMKQEKGIIRALFGDVWYDIMSNGKILPKVTTLPNGYILESERERSLLKSTDGTLINEFDFSRIEKFKYDVAIVTKVVLSDKNEYGRNKYEKYCGLINKDGKLLFPAIYKRVVILNKKYIALTKEEEDVEYAHTFAKLALYNINGNLLIPFICSHIERVQTNIFDISIGMNDSKRYIKKEYFKENCRLSRNGYCTIRFDFKKGTLDYLNDKIAADVRNLRIGQMYSGKIIQIKQYGLFIEIEDIGTGLLHISELKKLDKDVFDFSEDDIVDVKILDIDIPKNRFTLTLNT